MPQTIPQELVRARWAVAVLFFANGALVGGLVPYFPAIQESLHLTKSALGAMLFFSPLGAVLSALQMGRLIQRLGTKAIILIAGTAVSFAVPFAVAAPNIVLFGVGLFLFGLTNAAFDASMNSQSVNIQHRYPKPMLSFTHGCWSFGGFAAAGIVALASSAHAVRVGVSLTLSAILLVVILVSGSFALPESEHEEDDAPVFAFPRGPLLLVGILCIIAFGIEGAGFDWAAVYLRSSLHTSEALAAMAFGAFAGAMAAGRMVGDMVVAKLGHARAVQIGAALSALGLVIAALASSPWQAIAGFAITGLGLSNMVPILFLAAGSMPGIPTGTGIAAVTSLGYSAFFFVPPMIGFIGDNVSMSFAFICIASAALVMLVKIKSVLARTRMDG